MCIWFTVTLLWTLYHILCFVIQSLCYVLYYWAVNQGIIVNGVNLNNNIKTNLICFFYFLLNPEFYKLISNFRKCISKKLYLHTHVLFSTEYKVLREGKKDKFGLFLDYFMAIERLKSLDCKTIATKQ